MNFLLCEPVFNSQYAICDALSKNYCYTPPLLRTNTHRAHLERKKNARIHTQKHNRFTHTHGGFHPRTRMFSLSVFFCYSAVRALLCDIFAYDICEICTGWESGCAEQWDELFLHRPDFRFFSPPEPQWKQVTMMVAAAAPFGNCKPFSTYAAQNTWTLGCVQKHAGELVKPFFYFFSTLFLCSSWYQNCKCSTKQKPSKSSDNSVNCLNCKTPHRMEQTTVWSSQKSLTTDSLFFTFGHFRVNFAHCCVLLFLHKAAKALEVGYSLLPWSISNGIFLYEIIIRLNSLEVMVISLRDFFLL